ncbi:hypothetical protein, partial [uncultured Bacteroides sp.]|uniref:hypothetical protein n=1 Tax=uncultured Bacteroides sp. TaxID=162156 RepID=UPI002593FE85
FVGSGVKVLLYGELADPGKNETFSSLSDLLIKMTAWRNFSKLRHAILGTLAKNTYFCPTNIEKLFCFSFFMFPQKEAEIKSKQFLNESSRIRKP